MEILKFYGDACMPCRVVGKMLEKLEGVVITPCNVAEKEDLVEKYNIQSTPTLIFLKEGNEVGRIVGMTTLQKIQEMLLE